MATDNIIGTFFEKAEGRAYELNEGDVSIDTGYSTINGAKQSFFKFENPVEAENFLEFDLANGELLMKGATTKATHITMYDAEFPSGKYPTEPVTDGSYKRFVTAFKLKTGELQLPLVDDNQAIKSGDFLGLDAYNTGLDKATGDTGDVVALEDKSANDGGYILCYLHKEEIPFLE